ncbi:MAG TPA: DUF4097 family beta strand repeat-containing protein [Bryobacteraceae bacterium]|nr:DUF4097 family beta strand repeat-containing protein [Bryobacteraceae bacterium]
MRPRGSIVGPLILITIGVVFLLRTVWPGFSVFDVFAVYWPYLLIVWGVLQIIEISVRARSRGPIPGNGITAGGWFLVLLICLVGFTMFEVHGPDTWWRRVSFNQGMDWFGEAHNYSIASQTQRTGASPRLVIQDFRGNARIVGGDVSQIEVSGHKTIRAMKDAEAYRADEATPVVLVADGNVVTVHTNQQKAPDNVRISTDLEITVPRATSVEAVGRLGDFDVSDITGNVSLSSENAGVRLQNIGGNVTVETRHGDVVRCSDVKGNVDLRGRSSDVELEKIAGQVTINGSYSGSITLRDLAKPLRVDNFHTVLIVQKVNGQITMDRGTLSAQNIVGPAQFTTHATDVDVTGFTQPLEVTVDKGDISLRPGKGPLGRMVVRTRAGNIDLALPETSKFDLKATTDHGDIENEFGQPLQLETAGRGAKLTGMVGGGPDLNLATDRGAITVRKATAEDLQPPVTAHSQQGDAGDAETEPKAPKTPKTPPPQSAPHTVVL